MSEKCCTILDNNTRCSNDAKVFVYFTTDTDPYHVAPCTLQPWVPLYDASEGAVEYPLGVL